MNRKSYIGIYLKLLFAAFFWGGTFIAGRTLAGSVGPFSAAFLRFLIASFFLFILVYIIERKIPVPEKKHIVPIFLLGFSGVFLYNFCFFNGLKYIEAGRASVIVANNPIFIALFSAFLFKERLTFIKILGILVSITGAVVVITKGDITSVFKDGFGIGEIYIFCTVASWVTYSLLGKTLMKEISPVISVAYSVWAGTLLLLVPAFIEGIGHNLFSYSLIDWSCFGYLGIFGTVVAFIFYYQGIVALGPTKAGLFINFVPISGVFLSFLILEESLTLSLLIGLLLVCFGIILTNLNFYKN